MLTEEFNFDLPAHLIAQQPLALRGASRMLHIRENDLLDAQFADFLTFMQPNDVLILNNTRVIKARLYGQKQSGGKVEVLVERVINAHEVLAQVRASHSPKTGSFLNLAKGFAVEVLGREGEFFHLRCSEDGNFFDLLERFGKLPLPPYIAHEAEILDEQRYQTVYAEEAGAVAAPTAGLHFDEEILDSLRNKGVEIAYVTLHVGAGTFQPVRVEKIQDHVMHSERYHIPQETVVKVVQARARNGRVVAVGTTSLRALESAAMTGVLVSGQAETKIFISPGYQFKVVDVLLTNFHLPKSTLLMLVSAFGGMETIRKAYRHAVLNQYRFFSYGDAMLIERTLS